MNPRHFCALEDAGTLGLDAILAEARARKELRAGWPQGRADPDRPLAGYVLAMIFEKPSTRTRVSFDMAIRQLGGSSIVLDVGSLQLGRGETPADTARVLSRMVDAIVIRTDDPEKLDAFVRHATIPVINGLTDASHPCQIAADLMTVAENGLDLRGSQWAWCGDGNNVLHSLLEAAGLMKFAVRVACPEGFDPDPVWVEGARRMGATVTIERDPKAAVQGADVVVTDTWVSMGQEGGEARMAALRPYQVTEALMAMAAPHAQFLHCLPAHRDEEVVAAVIDGPQSCVWDEAENRLHVQKAILLWAFGRLVCD